MPDTAGTPIADPVIATIRAERAAQDAEWGGPSHDDAHTAFEWCETIDHQIARAYDEDKRGGTEAQRATIVRARLIKVAAVAVAGIESLDRRFPPTA